MIRTDVDFRRLIQTLAIIGAGVALTGFAALALWALLWGYAWPVALRPDQLRYVAWFAYGLLGLLLVALLSLGRRNFTAHGPGGIEIESTGGEDK